MATYTNPTIDQEFSPKFIYYADNRCAIFTCNGSPEGVILANTGSIALSDNGNVYKKTTDLVVTGWIELAALSATGVARNIRSDNTVVGNIGAGVDTLDTFSLLAGSLPTNNSYLDTFYAGTFANTAANLKRILLSFGGTTLFDSAVFDFEGAANASNWTLSGKISRISDVSIVGCFQVLFGEIFAAPAFGASAIGNGLLRSTVSTIATTDLDINNQTILLQGEGVADNDIVKRLAIIEVVQI